jgi:benzoate-CoA ligase family protein
VRSRVNASTFYLDRHLDEGRAEHVALVDCTGSTSYQRLYDMTLAMGRTFAQLGVRMEARVLIALPDSPVLVTALWGAMRIGAVPVVVSPLIPLHDHILIVADCRPSVIVVPAELAAGLAPLLHDLPAGPVVVVAGGHDDIPAGFHALDRLLDEADGECPVAPTVADDMALIQYTSGSTGAPKGVVHLHAALLALPGGFLRRLELDPSDLSFSAAKIAFGYGMGNSVFFPMAVGGRALLYAGRPDAHSVVDLVHRFRPTVFYGVPVLYAALLELSSRLDMDMSSVRLFVSAGEHLTTTLAKRWLERFGTALINGIGATECLHIFMTTAQRSVPLGATGLPVDGYEVRLLDDAGKAVPAATVASLWVRGPTNAARYFNRQDATVATMVGPWTRTGDQLFRDESGVFHYFGRSDDVIKVGGLKVAPTEVESVLTSHEAVSQCAVVGEQDDDGVTTVVAYVLPVAEALPERDLRNSLGRLARDQLAAHKVPRRIEFVTELPTTSTGKLARFRLRQDAAEPRPPM